MHTSATGDQPFLTFHDDATGERTELGHATVENWVAKTANLLVEELGVGRGDRVALLLGPHWTTAVLAFACWRVGACVVPGDPAAAPETLTALLEASGARVVAAEESAGDAAPVLGAHADVLMVGAGMGARALGDLPPGVLGYGEEVLAFGDEYDGPRAKPDDDDWLLALPRHAGALDAPIRLTQRNLLAAADALREWGLSDADRVLLARPPRFVDGLVLGLLAPWVAGASVVVVRDPVPAALWDKVTTEHATLALADAPILDALPAPPAEHGLTQLLVPTGASPDVVRRASERTGVPVAVGHGVVGTVCASTLTPADADTAVREWLASIPLPTVGVATAGAEIAVMDDEICVRGPVVTPDSDEWLHTGDAGFTETGPDGREWIFVTGSVSPAAPA